MPFEKISFNNPKIIGLKAIGRIAEEDYTRTLYPMFNKARSEGEKVKLYMEFGDEFEGYDFGAMWEDSKFGLKFLRTVEKAAIVTDINWLSRMTKFFGSLVPCPVKVFNCGQQEAAKVWIEYGKAGLAESLDEKTGVLTIKIYSALSSEDFEVVTDVVDSYIERNGKLHGIVIKAEKFPGWENFGSFLKHLNFIKEHHKLISRVALVVEGQFPKIAQRLGEHFVQAEIKQFDEVDFDEAEAWAAGPDHSDDYSGLSSKEDLDGPEPTSLQ